MLQNIRLVKILSDKNLIGQKDQMKEKECRYFEVLKINIALLKPY